MMHTNMITKYFNKLYCYKCKLGRPIQGLLPLTTQLLGVKPLYHIKVATLRECNNN